MDDRATIAAMCLQGMLAAIEQDEIASIEGMAVAAVQQADALIAELAHTAPPAVESPLRNVKPGDVLISRTGEQFQVTVANYPLCVARLIMRGGQVGSLWPYNLAEDLQGCTIAPPEIRAALAKD